MVRVTVNIILSPVLILSFNNKLQAVGYVIFAEIIISGPFNEPCFILIS